MNQEKRGFYTGKVRERERRESATTEKSTDARQYKRADRWQDRRRIKRCRIESKVLILVDGQAVCEHVHVLTMH